MLGAIANAYQTHLGDVVVTTSKKNLSLLGAMYREGLIRGYSYNAQKTKVYLKYSPRPALSHIHVMSRGIPTSLKTLASLSSGNAVYFLHTIRGVMTLTEALRYGLGGFIICKVI